MSDMMPAPILVTGCARSGTSIIAGAIHICGAFSGNVDSHHDYRKSMFENKAIISNLCKPYLNKIGVDPKGQYPLPSLGQIEIVENWKSQVEEIMIRQGYQGGKWMFKSNNMCLMWPVWHNAFPNAKWVIVRRRTGDIIHSCQKTGYMRAFKDRQNQLAVGTNNEIDGWKWWVHQHEAKFVEMMTEGLNLKIIWPERMVFGDYNQMYEMMEWLGLQWKSKVLNFIDPKLYRGRKMAEFGNKVLEEKVNE